GDPAERRPDERAVPLVAHPRVEVVGDEPEREARPLGDLRLAEELVRRMVLGGEVETELHAASSTGLPGQQTRDRSSMEPASVAELQVLLEGVPLPAERASL